MAYLTQTEAAIYAPSIGTMAGPFADALLSVSSDMVDNYCQRTFDTALDPLPSPVAMSVALWAEELSKGTDAGREKNSERIGDYAVSYGSATGGDDAYPCPKAVAVLLAPYRVVVVG